jgi:predicted amidophosphoribosyltransferase
LVPILKKHERYWGHVAIYGDYKPWTAHKAEGGDGSNYPAHSGRILDLKDDKAGAVDHFKDMFEPELSDDIVIVTVPSHDPAKTPGGLQKLAGRLAGNGNRVDGSGCLVRTKKHDKLAHGGDRSKDSHLKSMEVKNAGLIKGKNVLLLDDVATSGNSLEAGSNLLIKAEAKTVRRAAIGKTI